MFKFITKEKAKKIIDFIKVIATYILIGGFLVSIGFLLTDTFMEAQKRFAPIKKERMDCYQSYYLMPIWRFPAHCVKYFLD